MGSEMCIRDSMRDVREELSSGKLVETKKLDELLEMLAAIRRLTSLVCTYNFLEK